MRKTRAVKKSDYVSFLAKAKQFGRTMDQAIDARQWDSAGLQAVHTVISASDALCAYFGGKRSADPDHREVVGLLQEILGQDFSPVSRQVTRVIQKKNIVEYEERRLTEKEAQDMARDAKRFLTWATGTLP